MMHEQPRRLSPIDFRRLKDEVPIAAVLQLYAWKPNAVRQGGTELRGPCPIHGSKSETSTIFSVSPQKNAFKCFSCDAGGNQIDLAGHYFGIPREESVRVAVALCRELGIDVPRIDTEKRS